MPQPTSHDEQEASSRLRRARKTRAKIAEQRATRLVVHRTNCHIYAQIIAPDGDKVLAERLDASRPRCARTSRTAATRPPPTLVGKRIAETREGARHRDGRVRPLRLQYHGRVKALAEAAREGGLKF